MMRLISKWQERNYSRCLLSAAETREARIDFEEECSFSCSHTFGSAAAERQPAEAKPLARLRVRGKSVHVFTGNIYMHPRACGIGTSDLPEDGRRFMEGGERQAGSKNRQKSGNEAFSSL